MTGGGPVATQDHAFVLGCKGIGELLAGRTNVNVLVSHVAEVLLAEGSFGLCVRGHRLWQRNRDTGLPEPIRCSSNRGQRRHRASPCPAPPWPRWPHGRVAIGPPRRWLPHA